MNSRIDRTVIEAFFTWNPKGWELLIGGGLFAWLLGAFIAVNEFPIQGMCVLALGVGLVVIGLRRKGKLRKLYVALKRAKNDDFVRILLRSIAKTNMDLRNFADLPAREMLPFDPTGMSPNEQDTLEVLKSKVLYLFGRQSNDGYTRFVNVGGRFVGEFSPLLISIFYVTRSELIVYSANVDFTKGDLLVEQITRSFLRDLAEITTTSATERVTRAADATMFAKYEKVMKTTLEEDMIRVHHAIQVTKRNGQVLHALASVPQYRAGELNVLDHEQYDAGDQFNFVARRITEAILNAS